MKTPLSYASVFISTKEAKQGKNVKTVRRWLENEQQHRKCSNHIPLIILIDSSRERLREIERERESVCVCGSESESMSKSMRDYV